MAEVIRMPLLSDTMKEGVIAQWNKKVGDKVKADEAIAEVETDKATMEVIPYVEGTLLYIGVEKGEAAPVNGIIAIIGEKGEDYKALLEKEKKSSDDGAKKSSDSEEKTEKAADNKENKEDKKAPAATKEKPKDGSATVIRMPLLSDTMKEGKIINWLKQEGDQVAADEAIAEVETDKATMEVMPYVEGTLLHIGVPAGSAAKVNQIIAIVGKKGTDIAPYLEEEEEEEKEAASGGAKEEKSTAPSKEKQSETESAEAPAASRKEGERIRISPLARKMAEEKGIPLEDLEGTGDGGRIVKRDVEGYTPGAAAATGAIGSAAESHTDISLSQMRKTVARRLSESKFNAPHFYLRISVRMDAAIAAREKMNEVADVKISFNDLIIKASAMALRKHPEVNSSWRTDFIRQHHHIHIGTAVAIEDGLIVPVVKFADQQSLAQIAKTTKTLIGKAKNKKLQPPEFSGNTFSVSNLGMMDIDEFTAIINPPDSCILAVGKINPEPVVIDGEVSVAQMLRLTLSCDHRVVDGAKGAEFLQTLKGYLEQPVTMLV